MYIYIYVYIYIYIYIFISLRYKASDCQFLDVHNWYRTNKAKIIIQENYIFIHLLPTKPS